MTREHFDLDEFRHAAWAECQELHWNEVMSPVLFITLTEMGHVTAQGLKEQGFIPKTILTKMREALIKEPRPRALGFHEVSDPTQPSGPPPVSKNTIAIMVKAEDLAKAENTKISEKHLLAAILCNDPDQSWTIRALKNLGVDLAALSQKAGLRAETPTLDRLGRDLSMLAREGKLDPMFGRKKELRLLVRTLARKRKNNPVMTGEAGVGKTAIVEGLAQKAESGRVPILVGKRIVEISAAGLVAGTKYRGQFAEQMLKLIEEIKQDGNIVLFIDELHTILGAGRVKGGALDAGNILKPALARGELSVIGATTTEEYERYIASDAALERRFEPILVKEPTKAETKKILMGAKKEYEKHHEVTITEEAVDACVELSMRYLPDHNLPDKAIALMDDACTRTLMPDSISVMASPNDRRVTPVLVALVLTDRLNMPIELLERMDSGEFDSSPGADRDNIRRIAKLKKRRLTHPQYNVYVIDLDKAVLKQKKFRNENPDYKEGKPCVYVGMTSKTPEARFEQHKRGFKANRFVKKFGIRLRPRDFERHNPMTFEDACKMEIEIARRRKKRGYGVWQK